MIKVTFLSMLLLVFSVNCFAGYMGFPDDREEIYQWCALIDLDQLESELGELSDEEIEMRIGEETDYDEIQFVGCVLSFQAFVKGVETASKKNGLSPPKLCDEKDISLEMFLLNGAKDLDGFAEIAWEYFYGRCSK